MTTEEHLLAWLDEHGQGTMKAMAADLDIKLGTVRMAILRSPAEFEMCGTEPSRRGRGTKIWRRKPPLVI